MATITITWTDSNTPDVTSHKIYRDDVFLVEVANGVETYDDTTAVEGETYKYEVQAVSPSGESTDEVLGENMDTITAALVPDPDNLFTNQFFEDTDGNGTADGIAAAAAQAEQTIVTGNGHIGNAQRAEQVAGAPNGYFRVNITGLANTSYTMTCMARDKGTASFFPVGGSNMALNVANESPAVPVTKVFTASNAITSYLFYIGGATVGNWVEISNLVIKLTP